jgi:hypothetical protein
MKVNMPARVGVPIIVLGSRGNGYATLIRDLAESTSF